MDCRDPYYLRSASMVRLDSGIKDQSYSIDDFVISWTTKNRNLNSLKNVEYELQQKV